jgi:hypothetical protein
LRDPRNAAMTWAPFFTLDLVEHGLLPDGWEAATRALADAPERHAIDMGDAPWSFAVVEGDVLRDRLPWLWRLYHGALRDFAGAAVGFPLFAANRLRSSMTLNILSGAGAWSDWHNDMNPVTGLLFATAADADGAGDLVFRDGAGQQARLVPRPGLFVCFEGHVEHQVTPMASPGPRLSLPLLYYRSPTDQPPAFDVDIYTLQE